MNGDDCRRQFLLLKRRGARGAIMIGQTVPSSNDDSVVVDVNNNYDDGKNDTTINYRQERERAERGGG